MFRRWTNAKTYDLLNKTFIRSLIIGFVLTAFGFLLERTNPASGYWAWCFLIARWAYGGALVIAAVHVFLRAMARYAYGIK